MNTNDELKRLNFEDKIWVLFAILCFINIYGDDLQKKYLYTNLDNFETESNKVFTITLIVTLLIYIYFFARNYNSYKNASSNEKELYTIKVFGSTLLIIGIICLIYFQTNNKNFIGTPSL